MPKTLKDNSIVGPPTLESGISNLKYFGITRIIFDVFGNNYNNRTMAFRKTIEIIVCQQSRKSMRD